MQADIDRRITFEFENKTLAEARILILHFTYWTELEDFHAPAEIGLVEMTLQGGVKKVYSQLVDPGDVPEG